MAETIDIPEVCIDAMRSVYYGAFIYDVNVANRLAVVRIQHPEFIVIGEPAVELKRRPIFAAVLTEQGKAYIDELH